MKNGYKVYGFSVQIYVPTTAIGCSVFRHHSLLIPKLTHVFDYLIGVSRLIVKEFYDTMTSCNSPITNVVGALKPEDEKMWPSWETFWRESIYISLKSNGERSIQLASYDPRQNQKIWYTYTYAWKERNRVKTNTITFGPERTIQDVFNCDGDVNKDYRINDTNMQVWLPFLKWKNQSKWLPQRFQPGFILEIIFKGWRGEYGIMNATSDPMNILAYTFGTIVQKPEFQEKLKLYPTHFGYEIGLGRWDRYCSTDYDTVCDFTSDRGKWYIDYTTPYISKIEWVKSTPRLEYIPMKPHCSETSTPSEPSQPSKPSEPSTPSQPPISQTKTSIPWWIMVLLLAPLLLKVARK